jgi:hypothetical protein
VCHADLKAAENTHLRPDENPHGVVLRQAAPGFIPIDIQTGVKVCVREIKVGAS